MIIISTVIKLGVAINYPCHLLINTNYFLFKGRRSYLDLQLQYKTNRDKLVCFIINVDGLKLNGKVLLYSSKLFAVISSIITLGYYRTKYMYKIWDIVYSLMLMASCIKKKVEASPKKSCHYTVYEFVTAV